MAPTIETPRLLLRPWRESDDDAWVAMTADPRVTEFLGWQWDRPQALALAERFATGLREKGYGWWVVEVKDAVPFAGVVLLQEVPFAAHFTPAFEVGWHFAAAQWGKGYATEGGAAALRFAFDELHQREVVALTSRLNLRSQRVMQRLGMTCAAADDFEHPYLAAESPLRPCVLYRTTRPAP